MEDQTNLKKARALGLSKESLAALYGETEDPTLARKFRAEISDARSRSDLNAAHELAAKAAKEMPKKIEFPLTKAQIFRAMNCNIDSEALLNRLFDQNTARARVIPLLADAKRALGDIDGAEELLNQMAPEDEGHEDALLSKLRLTKMRGDLPKALELAELSLTLYPKQLRIVREHADTLCQVLRYHDAAMLLDTHLAISAPEDGLFLARSDVAMLAGHFSLAAQILEHAPKDAETYKRYRRLDELQRLGNARSSALIGTRCLTITIEKDMDALDPQEHLTLADLRFVNEDWRGALRHYRLSGVNKSRNRMRTMRIATSHFRLLEFDACRKAIERVLSQSPKSIDALTLRAQLDLIQGNIETSLATSRTLFDTPDPRRMQHGVRLYKAYMRCERGTDAKAVMGEMLALAQDRFEPELLQCLLQFGEAKTAFELCKPWAAAAQGNPEFANLMTLIERDSALQFDIPHRIVQPDVPTSNRALDLLEMRKVGKRNATPAHQLAVPAALMKAWELSDQDELSFDVWQGIVRRATQSSSQMSQHTTHASEIEQFTDFPEPDALGQFSQDRTPLIIATSHFGPLVSSTLTDNLLADHDPVYLRTQQLDGLRESLLITTNSNSSQAAIALVNALRAGKSVSCAVDAPAYWQSNGASDVGGSGTIFGCPITISATPVKLAIAFKAPIFWIQPVWQDGRIQFEVQRMEQPNPDLPFRQAANAWAQEYLALIENLMRSGPENQNLNAPMWQHVLFNSGA